ncbi:uncharacterized protein LOC116264832 [Nymphaea colorata]|uniref:uncharacterized protein LOC116264832 n=1 Tax=Nymphaea colorata TaxID=210225 RepID=UPI00129EB61E|nr:uncharacterized protein LOC116264832 [Nymphaea colorata]
MAANRSIQFDRTESGNQHLEASVEYKAFSNPFSFGSTIKLDGANYDVWARTFMLSVVGHGKKYILEEDEPVEKSGKYARWEEENNIISAWLMNSTQPHIAAGLCYYNTAKDMWNSLRQTYSQDKNISKILQVQQELLQMQQGDMDLTEYFTKLKFAYEKMNSLKPPCKHCLKSHMEQMIVVKFLAGLSSDYSASKAQMLTGSDFPDLDEAFNRLNRLAITLLPSSNNSQPSALASFGGGRGGLYSSRGRGRGRGPGGRGRLQCTYCGRLGHLEDRCWNKVGKPNSSTSSSVTSSSSSIPNTHPVSMAPKANPTVASVDATSLNLSPAEIDLIMEHRSNATPSTSSASTVVTSSAYSAGSINWEEDWWRP